jgi:hypothetical protein
MPTVALDSEGTPHWNERTFPLPVLESEDARKKYVELLNRALAARPSAADREAQARRLPQAAQGAATGMVMGLGKLAALTIYPVDVEETEMAAVKVSTRPRTSRRATAGAS